MTSGITATLKTVPVIKALEAVDLSPSKRSAIATTEAAGDIAIAITGAMNSYPPPEGLPKI